MSTSNSTSAGLEIDHVHLQINGVAILNDVSLAVARGRATGLIGANGSGKSSLLNVVSGYYRATQGSVRLGGRDTTELSPSRIARLGTGRSFQSIGRFRDLTVLEYVMLGLEATWDSSMVSSLLGLPRARRAERVALESARAHIEEFGLTRFSSDVLHRCPYGVRKVADLLRATIGQPSLLLLDEPTSGVAAADRATIARVITQWRTRSETSVVLVDHDIAFVADVVEELVALSAGRVVDTGPPQRVLENPEVLAGFLGSDPSEGT